MSNRILATPSSLPSILPPLFSPSLHPPPPPLSLQVASLTELLSGPGLVDVYAQFRKR